MIKTIIIDDEVHCQKTLSMLLEEFCPDVQLLEICPSAKKGLEPIEKLHPDLVFLDIEMPVMNGFSLKEVLISLNDTARINRLNKLSNEYLLLLSDNSAGGTEVILTIPVIQYAAST